MPGLSPLARGTRAQQVAMGIQWRFIPAGAGNTHGKGRTEVMAAVYPRWRGEHQHTLIGHTGLCGLSPLARGTRGYLNWSYPLTRFIPAGAGNTRVYRDDSIVESVYPRWRGEHGSSAFILVRFNGLSPLARGTLQANPHRQSCERFIPAGAGNTTQ